MVPALGKPSSYWRGEMLILNYLFRSDLCPPANSPVSWELHHVASVSALDFFSGHSECLSKSFSVTRGQARLCWWHPTWLPLNKWETDPIHAPLFWLSGAGPILLVAQRVPPRDRVPAVPTGEQASLLPTALFLSPACVSLDHFPKWTRTQALFSISDTL